MQLNPQVASLICLALAVGSGLYFVWTVSRQLVAKNWPTATGAIEESTLEEDADGWSPRVRYTYSVHKKLYTNDQLYFFDPNKVTERVAQKQLSPYPVGKKVAVHYNPSKPEQAVLDKHMPLWRPVFWLCFSLFCFFAAVEMWGY